MADLRNRSYEKELLDDDNVAYSDMLVTLQELNLINSFLGGHNITLKGVEYFLKQARNEGTLTIAEIGSGGGDNLKAIHEFLTARNQNVNLVGIDIKPECIHYAKQNGVLDAAWICSDYRLVQWTDEKPDIIFSSLFCHHFTDEQLIEQLTWLKENSRRGFFINDLHRHPVAYHSISVLTRLFSNSRLVRNDGPLSVRRGFKRTEWERLMKAAGIKHYTITWQWAFRHLITVTHEH